MSTDPNAWLLGGTVPSAKFEARGDTITGVISETPELRQQTDFDTQQPKFWDDGKPMMQLVVTISTDQRDPANPDDDGTRRIYVKGKLQQAVASAIRKAGAKGLEVGGTLQVSYVGDDEPKRRGMSGAKLYTAEYTPATAQSQAAFFNTAEPAAAAPAPAVATAFATPEGQRALAQQVQPTSAAAAALGNLTPEQIQQLLAAQQQAGNAQPVPAPF